jgi:hypothetical protein
MGILRTHALHNLEAKPRGRVHGQKERDEASAPHGIARQWIAREIRDIHFVPRGAQKGRRGRQAKGLPPEIVRG